MTKIHALALLLMTPALSGCLTPLMWEGFMDSTDDQIERQLPPVRPRQLVRAVRSGEARYVIEASYTDGSLRRFEFQPDAHGPDWPASGEQPADDDLPWLEQTEIAFPLECDGYVPVEVALEGEQTPASPDGWPVLRLCRGRLEFREGHDHFRHVARFPREAGETVYEDGDVTVGDFVLGTLVVIATPITAGLDASLIATIFGLAFI